MKTFGGNEQLSWGDLKTFKASTDYSIPGDTALDRALFLAAAGLPVFPLSPYGSPPSKARLGPAYKMSGQHLGSVSAERVRKVFGDYGIATDCYGVRGGDGLAILDLDRKDGKEGPGALYEVAEQNGWVEYLASTLTVGTPSDGFHLYVGMPQAIKVPTGSDMNWLNGVDMRGRSGWAMGPGARKVYETAGSGVRGTGTTVSGPTVSGPTVSGPTVSGLYKVLSPTGIETPADLRAAILPAPTSLVEWIASARGTGAGGRGAGEGGGWAWSFDQAVREWQPVVQRAGGIIPNGSRNCCLWSLASGLSVDVMDRSCASDEEATKLVATELGRFFDLCPDLDGIKDTPETMAERAVSTHRKFIVDNIKPAGMSKRTWAMKKASRQ